MKLVLLRARDIHVFPMPFYHILSFRSFVPTVLLSTSTKYTFVLFSIYEYSISLYGCSLQFDIFISKKRIYSYLLENPITFQVFISVFNYIAMKIHVYLFIVNNMSFKINCKMHFVRKEINIETQLFLCLFFSETAAILLRSTWPTGLYYFYYFIIR